MTQKAEPLTKLLLPVDGEGTYKAACVFAGSLASMCSNRISKITLFHAMAGRYLSTHMANIDIRVDTVLESETFKRLKKDFIDKKIRPVLDDAAKTVKNICATCQVDEEVVDGKPADAIIKFVTENNYSTIIMQRRCMDPVKGKFIGSITSGILYGPAACSVYIPGNDLPLDGSYCVKTILIPIDGSKGSMAAVREASVLAGCAGDAKVILLNVLDVVDIAKAAESEQWPSPVQEAEATLEEAEKLLVKSGMAADRIEKKVLPGDPADVIVAEAGASNVDIIYIGRTVRHPLTDIIVGSVGRAVLGRCAERTLAVITPEED